MNRTLKRILCTLLAALAAGAAYAAITDGYVFVNGAYIKQSDGSGPYSIDSAGTATIIGAGGGGGGGGAVAGSVAHDAVATASNPVLGGGFASAAAPTDVSADGDAVRSWHLRNGAQATQQTFAGVLAATGSGAITAGTQRVTLATDDALIAAVNASNPELGATNESAAASDTATSGLNGLIKRLLQHISTFLAKFTSTATSDTTRLPVDVRDGVVLATATCTSNATMTGSNIDVSAYGTLSLQVTSIGGGVTISFEGSNDNTNFLGWKGEQTNTTNASGASTANGTNSYILGRRYKYLRLVCSSYTSGTPTVVIVGFAGMASTHVTVSGGASTMQVGGAAGHSAARNGNPAPVSGRAVSANSTDLANGDTSDFFMDLSGATTVKPYSVSGSDWNYAAAASGISNTTTAVTIKTAGAGSLRNYVTAVDLMCEALGTATEIAIRDGAGGTVLWRTKVGTGGLTNGRHIRFPNPLRGTAATLLEVVTLTASGTGACYFNASGYEAL